MSSDFGEFNIGADATGLNGGIPGWTPRWWLASNASRASIDDPANHGGYMDPVVAPTMLSAFVTQNELDTWKARSVNGPFRITGDYATNSPNVWEDIVAWKNDFTLDPAATHYRGPVPPDYTGGAITLGATYEPSWTSQWRPVLAAAFFSLVADDATVRQSVATRLVGQKDAIGLQFNDTAQWYDNMKNETDGNPVFYVAGIMGAYATCLDYVLLGDELGATTSLTAAEIKAIRDWLYYSAEFFGAFVHDRISASLFTDRTLGGEPPYTPKNTAPTYEKAYENDTALSIYSWSRYFNNRRCQIITGGATMSALLRRAELEGTWTQPASLRGFTSEQVITAAKQWCKDVIAYAFFPGAPDPFTAEFHRGVSVSGEGGWTYSASMLAGMCTIADLAIRHDGTDLFVWTTRAGYDTSECKAGDPDKSIPWMIEELEGYVHGNRYVQHYGTEQIDAVNTAITAWPESQAAHDMQAYWIVHRHLTGTRADYVKAVVERTATGITTAGWVVGLGGAFGSIEAQVGDVGIHIAGPFMHWGVEL